MKPSFNLYSVTLPSKIIIHLLIIFTVLSLFTGCRKKPAATIYIDENAGKNVDLAAREIRKTIYQRTGELLPVVHWQAGEPVEGKAFFVGTTTSGLIRSSGFEMPSLERDDFFLKTLPENPDSTLLVCGGSEIGTLYAAYHLAEQMGIGFYLHGDVIPDKQIDFSFPDLDVNQSPLFSRRGIQPFHDFPEGPDWWNREDYKAVMGQLPKLKMNFIGFHTYPEGGVGPEPLVWIGLKEDVGPDGKVNKAYHARHFTTLNGTWGYEAKKTSDFTFGSSLLFSRDAFGADYMKGRAPWPDPQDETGLFNDMGSFLNKVFSFAGELGIKTCLGTEIPLVLPNQFISRLEEKGLDPEAPEVRQQIYEGIFTRIKRTHPADFYWFWTPESWTWSGNKKEDIDRVIRDFNASQQALETINPGFKLATCGWVLGPADNRALFDQYLPKDIAFSCINRHLGFEPVDTAFARIEEREQWAIPWMEDDPAMTIPQLWVGRMRRDAADAYAYGCNGYLGIHWRTRVLGMNVSALAKAAWEQPWNPRQGEKISPDEINDYLDVMEKGDQAVRDMESLDFYREWCRIQFGPEASDQLATLFSNLDGVQQKTINLNSGLSNLPRPATWIGGPGNLLPNESPWDSVKVKYAFVEEMEDLRPQIKGNGSLERFDYWLNQFKYLRAFGKLGCSAGLFNREAKKLATMDEDQREQLLSEKLIPLLKQEAGELKNVHYYLMASVTTWGGIGNVTNWQQHIIPSQIRPHTDSIKKYTSDTSWVNDLFPKEMDDLSRVIVPSPPHILKEGEAYRVKAICFNVSPEHAVIRWKPLGSKSYQEADLVQISDTYWEAVIPPEEITTDFEYYIEVTGKEEHLFPASAPGINHAVTLMSVRL